MAKITELKQDDTKTNVLSFREALFFTTMSIIGLSVEVYIKDGSVFSGIFHTASIHDGYGIVLKKAKMIKKGKRNANVPNGVVIDSLVVLPDDLVQVVAKGVTLPGDCAPVVASSDKEEAVFGTPRSFQGFENGVLDSKGTNRARQVEVDSHQNVENGFCHNSESMKELHQVNGSVTSLNGCSSKLNLPKENHVMVASDPQANGSPSSLAPKVSSAVKAESYASRGSLAVPAETSLPQKPLINRTVKESKLNPSAKVFSPSFSNLRTTPPLVPTVPSYVPNNIPAVHVAAAQPDVGIRSIMQRSSWPIKFVPFVNPTPTIADNGLQYIPSQIAGHIATRAQPLRQGAQYQPIQHVPPYVHTNPQNAVFGRTSQVVYVHSVTHDVIQAPAALQQAPHPLMTSHQIHIPKHEGVYVGQPLQVSMTQPLMVNTPQPYAMSSNLQRSQAVYSSIHPVPVLGSNILYGTKFP